MDNQCEHVNVEINGVSIRHQPDSASDVNLWAQNHFDDFCSKINSIPKLIQAKKPLRAANWYNHQGFRLLQCYFEKQIIISRRGNLR